MKFHQRTTPPPNVSLRSALRDFFVNLLPVKQLPSKIIQRLYECDAAFIFLTHPRDRTDIYHVFPMLSCLKNFIPEKILFWILTICPCFVVAKVRSNQNINGFFISTPIFPQKLFSNRSLALKNSRHIIKFIKKITSQKVNVGLAAWWPIVTDGGAAFQRFLEKNDRIVVTNGHSMTLASIVMSVAEICKMAELPLHELKILVIGVGKIGGAVAEFFNGKVGEIGLIDQNDIRLHRFEDKLRSKFSITKTARIVVSSTNFSEKVLPALFRYHIAVCTTSNIGYVINEADVGRLRDSIILDDARPEAFPRIFNPNCNLVVLEGGLMKIQGIQIDSDFGFGNQDNIFGCLAEAFLLSLDESGTVKPTLGEIDYDNFSTLLNVCNRYGISHGDFKCGQKKIEADDLKRIMENKIKLIKNLC